ncbi:SPOSA6832_02624, partial [Sporobolomyces salmonicolor]
MPAVDLPESFMDDLFAELDANVFSSPSVSSQPAPPTQPLEPLPPSTHRTFTPRKPDVPRVSASSQPRMRAGKLKTNKAAVTFLSSPTGPLPPTPPPFWADPFARPIMSPASRAARDKQERGVGITGASTKRAAKGGRESGLCSPERARGVRRERDGAERRGAVKHVGIEVEEEKENSAIAREGPGAKGKGTEAVLAVKKEEEKDEFDDLMDGIDWEKEMMGIEAEGIAVEKPEHVPRSKQFVRCTVEEVIDDIGSSKQMQQVRSLSPSRSYPAADPDVLVFDLKTIIVTSSAFEGSRQVVLCDDWIDTPVEAGSWSRYPLLPRPESNTLTAGDTINLIGPFDASVTEVPSLTLNRSTGLLILHPDILVSSTKVADSSHCTRKALLQELIRTLGGATPSLAYGNMLHELMQRCLLEGRWDDEWRYETINDIVKENGGMLWTMDLSFDAARLQLRERSKEFGTFAERFMGDKPKPDAFLSDPRAVDTARSRLSLSATLAVEEDLWSPRYGLKGKIDVSISSNTVDSIGFSRKGTSPFEIKTGRAIAGMEHRAQTMLYTLLMSDRYGASPLLPPRKLHTGKLTDRASVQTKTSTPASSITLNPTRFSGFKPRGTRSAASSSPGTVSPHSSTATPPRETEVKVEAMEEADVDMDDDEAELWAVMGTPKGVMGRTPSEEEEDEEPPLLPPPIDDERSCKKCYVGDACMLFRRAVDGDSCISADANDPLQAIYEEKTAHLTEEHAEFFRKWEKLISFEEQELVRFKKEIWTMEAEERAQVGRCFAGMVIDDSHVRDEASSAKIHRFIYRLRRQDALASQPSLTQRATHSLLGGALSVNDPVVVSLEDPRVLALARGFILALTPHDVILGLDHSLTNYPQTKGTAVSSLIFRIDKDELAAGMGRIRDNLIQLFVTGGDERRRRLVVDLEPPRFDASLVSALDRLIPSSLNDDQKRALEKVLAAQDYALILGMPGTGKTTTIAEVLKALAKAGKSVLLTSYTHSAVDNILLKVKDSGLSILRLGNRDKILPALHHYTLTPEDYATSLTDIDNKLVMPQIVATTCLGINEPIFTKRHFDVCIVDEASQVTLPTCLGPLRFADKFILVGDHHQLPPLVRNHAARTGGLDVSLFKRLSDAHPSAVVNLTHQYRMNEDIMLLSNKLVYSEQLKVGDELVAKRELRLPGSEGMEGMEQWLKEVLNPSRKVIFVDTDQLPAVERKRGSLIENELEACLVQKTVEAMSRCGVAQHDIGVITLYRQQIKLLQRKLQSFPDVEVLTADRSQGRDKECILMSLVRSNSAGHVRLLPVSFDLDPETPRSSRKLTSVSLPASSKQVGDLLRDWRRINVCLTRAKAKLVVFGSRSTLAHVALLQQFFDLVADRGWVYTLPGSVKASLLEVKSGEVKKEEEEEEDEKPVVKRLEEADEQQPKKRRKGAGALVLGRPLACDIVNSLA